MASITIFGHEYPMAYTVAAQAEIAKRFGGIEKIEIAFNREDVSGTMLNMAFCAAVMCKAHEDRERVRSKSMGNEYAGSETLSEEEIAAAIDPKEVPEIMKAVMAAMKEGNATTVEVEHAKGKNADATP